MPHSAPTWQAIAPVPHAPHDPRDAASPRPDLRQLLALSHGAGDSMGRAPRAAEAPQPDGPPPLPEANWPAAIEMIRDVGSRMRQARRYAQDVVAHSNDVVESTLRQLEDTERRLRLTEAAAQDALRRAEQAEAAARLADNRARRAEEEAEITRMKLAEAQTWLKRLYSSVQVEFREISEDRR
ncbi:hypothetical protein [Methylobacterium aerolatum]|uniref:Sec-independent protein translocase protein TatA n=1 Tax=Methylobacterium aerolatum TaxID=418708 RepID=A0ABU0HZN0_9HYPH|nr:hypothetical protein [Methylobacterium aerolatum]MDQ0447238.1 Sec-independent protein translocase protein TatA [Methylobacterium aerolatum]GJD36906.1 hypothetical protein FMGBMHLM_3830 [Methylobacterium aerolatum]